MTSVYDAAGGADGMYRLAEAWHARVMADEVVSHAFSHGFHPDHTARLAAYWGEALGGPASYSEKYGDETSVVRMHSGNGPHDEMDQRAIACFDLALDDAGITDQRLRQVLHDYFAWATTTTMARYHESADDVPDGMAIPQWSWTGLKTKAARVVSASREISAPAARIFELIADPAEQPRWDGNDNLRSADAGQRVRAIGDVFVMTLRRGGVRQNTVVEFEEGRVIAWRPNVPGREPPGHLWRWQLEPIDSDRTRVTHTYDWTELTDRSRFPRARGTTVERLTASLERLAAIAEN
jgi:hemoglobin